LFAKLQAAKQTKIAQRAKLLRWAIRDIPIIMDLGNYLGGYGSGEKKFHFFSLLPHFGVFLGKVFNLSPRKVKVPLNLG
jgi:hypothetical protein